MKIVLSLLFILAIPNLVFAQYTVIENQELEALLAEFDDIQSDGQILTETLENITQLNLNDIQNTNTLNLEKFVGLKTLIFENNSTTSLDLSSNSNLQTLKINFNSELLSIQLSAATDLLKLELINNTQLNSVNLQQCSSIRELKIKNSELLNLNFLDQIESLVKLNIINNPLLSELNFSDHEHLIWVNIENCPSLNSLSFDRNLVYLTLENLSGIQNLDLSNTYYLVQLEINNSSVQALDLSNKYFLKKIRLLNNTDLEQLEITNCIKLKNLHVTGSNLSSINTQNCTKLNAITLIGNSQIMTPLNISSNLNVEVYNMRGKPNEGVYIDVSNFDLSNNHKLEVLGLGNSTIDQNIGIIPDFLKPTIKGLYFPNTALAQLDLSNYPKLAFLNISRTQIENLDISSNLHLDNFIANNSKLNSVNFENCYRIKKIHIKNSPNLTSVNLKGSFNYTTLKLNLENTQNLTCVEVNNITQAIELSTSDSENTPLWIIENQDIFTSSCAVMSTFDTQGMVADYTLYPNPAKSSFSIDSKNKENPIVEILIFDSTLKKVAQFNFQKTYSIENLKSGTYFVKVKTQSQIFTKKLLKL